MDFQKKYGYIKENIEAGTHGDLILTVSVFDNETHLRLKGEDRTLLAYTTYWSDRPVLPKELRQLVNRQISVTGQIPNRVEIIDYTGHFMLVPTGSIEEDQLGELPMINMRGARRAIKPFSNKYEIVCQFYRQYKDELIGLVSDIEVYNGVSHINKLISVFNFEPEYAIYLHITPGSFYGFLYRQSDLLICINHPFKDVADISYYLLKLLELRHVEQTVPDLFVGGFITEASVLLDQLKIFFSKVNLLVLDGYQDLELMPEVTAMDTEN